MANSATPPLVRVLGLVWLAITSTAPKLAAVSVRGATSVGEAASISPRKPWMLATPLQSSLAVIWLVLLQFCVSEPLARLWYSVVMMGPLFWLVGERVAAAMTFPRG